MTTALRISSRAGTVKFAAGLRALLTPDPLLPQPVAAMAAFHVLMADRLESAWVRSFTDTYRGRGPEAVCADGSFP